jgi:predicted aminopeptidase
MKKKIGIIVLGVLLFAGLFYADLIVYGVKQLSGQLKLLRSTMPIEQALEESFLTTEEKSKLQLILHVRRWAEQELALNVGDNYSEIAWQDSGSTMYVVTAAHPFELKSYQWYFGPVGKMAYKGFFNKELALEEAERMQELGFDTDIGIAGGWSTLGILNDPVLSGMLNRDSVSLIELIIHESVHATVFRWGETEWNENLATAIGEIGAEQFVRNELQDEGLYERNRRKEEERSKRRAFIHEKALELDSTYKSWEQRRVPEDERMKQKKAWLDDFKKAYIEQTGVENWPEYKPLNNTLFTDFLNYRSANDSIKRVLIAEFEHDIPAFLESLE